MSFIVILTPTNSNRRCSLLTGPWIVKTCSHKTVKNILYLLTNKIRHITYIIIQVACSLFTAIVANFIPAWRHAQRNVTPMKRRTKISYPVLCRCSNWTICQIKNNGERADIERYFRGEILLYIVISPGENNYYMYHSIRANATFTLKRSFEHCSKAISSD